MNLLIVGADQPKAQAYARAASNLSLAHAATSASHLDALDDAQAVLLLEPLSDEVLARLAQSGARLLYDPPLFDSAARLEQLADFAERQGLWMLPLMPLRLLPVMQRSKAIAAEGTLGQLLYLKATYNQRMPRDKSRLTGALRVRGCQAVDLTRWLLGADFADVWVSRGFGQLGAPEGVDDIAILSFLLADKSYATVDISWSLPADYPNPASITIEMAGTGGSIRSDALNQNLQFHGGGASRDLNWGSDARTEALRALTQPGKRAPQVTLRELAAAQAICEGVARQGRLKV